MFHGDTMKLVVVSDNHGRQRVLEEIRLKHQNADGYFHCGDSELPVSYLDGFVSVMGNNDYDPALPEYRIIEMKGLRIFLTHGHRHLYFGRVDMLVNKAKKENCSLVLFGHTHTFFHQIIDGIHLVNPGSINYNRDGSKPSYAIIDVENKKISVKRMER